MHDTSFMFYQGLLPAAAGSADSRAGIPASVSPGPFTVRDMPVMGRNGSSQLLQVTRKVTSMLTSRPGAGSCDVRPENF